MLRLYFTVPARIKRVMLLLALLPCVPGLTFLVAGWVRDPRWSPKGTITTASAEYQRATQQAHGLYRAGAVALGMGALCGMVAGWQVMRRRDPEEEDEEE